MSIAELEYIEMMHPGAGGATGVPCICSELERLETRIETKIAADVF